MLGTRSQPRALLPQSIQLVQVWCWSVQVCIVSHTLGIIALKQIIKKLFILMTGNSFDIVVWIPQDFENKTYDNDKHLCKRFCNNQNAGGIELVKFIISIHVIINITTDPRMRCATPADPDQTDLVRARGGGVKRDRSTESGSATYGLDSLIRTPSRVCTVWSGHYLPSG